jgi:hypothetical protein
VSQQSVSLGRLLYLTGGLENCPEVALPAFDIVERTRDSPSIKGRYVCRLLDRITKLEPVMCGEERPQLGVGSLSSNARLTRLLFVSEQGFCA